jgi:endonuclease YncB( thermonuclease family)
MACQTTTEKKNSTFRLQTRNKHMASQIMASLPPTPPTCSHTRLKRFNLGPVPITHTQPSDTIRLYFNHQQTRIALVAPCQDILPPLPTTLAA